MPSHYMSKSSEMKQKGTGRWLPPGIRHDEYRTDHVTGLPGVENPTTEDRTANRNAIIIGDIPMHRIVRHVGTGRLMNFVIRWYGYWMDEDTVEQPSYTLQNIIAHDSSTLNRQAPTSHNNWCKPEHIVQATKNDWRITRQRCTSRVQTGKN